MLDFIKQHKKGIIGTIAFHGVLAILILSFGFSTPLPLPAEKGIMINFGNVENAAGATELKKSPSKEKKQTRREETQPQPQPQKQQEAKDIVTQDQEKAPAVKEKQENTQKKEQKTEPKEDPKPAEKEEQKKQEEQKEPEREVNKNALYPGKKSEEDGKSEGETKGEGNQGRESGTPYSDNHANVDSKGMGNVNYSLSGRNPESLPKPEYNYQVEGKVVVEITVDKYGNVTKAIAGVKGSTTLDDKLLRAAKKAALNAKFDRKPSAPAYQQGTITYYFRLQ